MKFLFIVSGYSTDQLKLQPWLTIHRIGLYFIQAGHRVHILTDCTDNDETDFSIHLVDSLRGTNASQIASVFESIQPDKSIVCVSPLSLVSASWYRIFEKYDACAFMSNAFYTFSEFLKAARFLSFDDLIRFGKQALIPGSFWALKLKKNFTNIICQSVNTQERMCRAVGSDCQVQYIPPGIDMDLWPLKKGDHKDSSGGVKFLYAGSLKKIRGYELILKAFSRIRDIDITLQILARGADKTAIKKIRRQVADFKIGCKVDIIGGWIRQGQFKGYLQGANVVLLPFVLVPSELPVTVMESIACGTPVVVSKIDGLTGAAGKAGYAIPHADRDALVTAIECLSTNGGLLLEFEKACQEVRNEMISWDQVAQKWLEALLK